mgnify:FL=1
MIVDFENTSCVFLFIYIFRLMKSREVICAIKQIARSNYKLVLSQIFIIFFLWAVGVVSPYLSGLYIDELIAGISFHSFVAFILIIAAANFLKIALRYLQSLVSTNLGQRMVHQINNILFQKIFTSNYAYYCNIDCAYYIDQINRDSNAVVNFLISNIFNFFLQAATIIASAVIVFQADKLLCVIILLLIPFYICTFLLNKNKMHTAKAALKQRLNQYASNCAEQINKLSYIKRNTLYHEMSERLTRSFNHLLSASLHSVSVDYLFTNLNQVVIILAYLCIIGIGGYKVTTGALSIGLFSVINTYFNMMISSVSYFVGIAGSYQDTKISFQRIQKILQTPDEDKGDLLPESIHQVEVKDFSLQYGSHVILNHCNVTFRTGCIYGLRGPNGTGKTTLLNALVGLFSGEVSGHIYYDGISTDQLDMPALRRKKISYIEQAPVLLNMSVRDYLHFGIEQNQTVSENQKQLLKVWDIDYLLDKEMNENGSNFSGGEKQKLALVRALSKESSLILLDEPTSALDKPSVAKLIDLLQSIKSNTIIIVVSHDLDMLEHCDEVINLSSIQYPSSGIINKYGLDEDHIS